MKRKTILFAMVVIIAAAGMCQAWEFKMKTEAGASYVSRYIWRGFDVYSHDHSAVQPFVNCYFGDTGWRTGIWMSRANGAGFENYEEIDYTVAYGNTWWPDTSRAVDWEIGYVYYNYPDGPQWGSCHDKDLDAQEMFASFSWPNICPAGVVPSYTIICMWPDEGGVRSDGCDYSAFRQSGGWAHAFGLAYDQSAPDWFSKGNPNQKLHWTAQAWYNDGLNGANVDHDWSHAVFGLSTDYQAWGGGMITPAIYYQSSWDDSVNPSDEWWFGLSGLWVVH